MLSLLQKFWEKVQHTPSCKYPFIAVEIAIELQIFSFFLYPQLLWMTLEHLLCFQLPFNWVATWIHASNIYWASFCISTLWFFVSSSSHQMFSSSHYSYQNLLLSRKKSRKKLPIAGYCFWTKWRQVLKPLWVGEICVYTVISRLLDAFSSGLLNSIIT